MIEPRGASLTTLGQLYDVEPYGLLEGRVLLRVPVASLSGPSTPVRFLIRTSDGIVQTIDSAFLGPAAP